MKNIILLFLLLAAIGCNNSGPKVPVDENRNTASDTASLSPLYDCEKLIVVNRIAAESIDRDWVKKNDTVLAEYDSTTVDLYINLSQIENDSTHEKKARWLKKNMTVIDFDKSKDAILGEHRITGIMNIQTPIKVMKLQEIIDIINQNGEDHYKDREYSYIYLSGDETNFSIEYKDTFEPGKNFYSIPLLKAIEKHYKTQRNTKFTFYNYKESIIFKINDGHLYNFSHFPKKKNTDKSVL